MAKYFWKNPRPLVFSLCVMTVLCILLLVLYGFKERENMLLKTSRSDQFLALAAGEAEKAKEAWQNGQPYAEVYHRICTAAEYLTMAAPTEENRQHITVLQEAGKILLEGENLPDSAGDSLEAVRQKMAESLPAAKYLPDEPDEAEIPRYPWHDQPCITRKEGLKTAETITRTKRCLTPASGKQFIYTCENVYVRLSQHGGIPCEIAVYTPVRHDPSYSETVCAFRSSRFLESILPRRSWQKDPVKTEEIPSGYRFTYPCGGGTAAVEVRSDTGRIVGLQILPGK